MASSSAPAAPAPAADARVLLCSNAAFSRGSYLSLADIHASLSLFLVRSAPADSMASQQTTPGEAISPSPRLHRRIVSISWVCGKPAPRHTNRTRTSCPSRRCAAIPRRWDAPSRGSRGRLLHFEYSFHFLFIMVLTLCVFRLIFPLSLPDISVP